VGPKSFLETEKKNIKPKSKTQTKKNPQKNQKNQKKTQITQKPHWASFFLKTGVFSNPAWR
jgi:hypothetical protein